MKTQEMANGFTSASRSRYFFEPCTNDEHFDMFIKIKRNSTTGSR